MPIFRQAIFPACPACHKSSGDAIHSKCPNLQNNKESLLWLDIETGTETCEACGATWSMEKSKHVCSCGVVFTGGLVWKGMQAEYERYANFEWMRRLDITKGSLQTRIIRYERCSFCRRWDHKSRPDKRPYAKIVNSGSSAGICNKCVRKYTRPYAFLFYGDKRKARCFFCSKKADDTNRLLTAKGISICETCLSLYRKM